MTSSFRIEAGGVNRSTDRQILQIVLPGFEPRVKPNGFADPATAADGGFIQFFWLGLWICLL